jgi:hypothetical protein
MRYEDTYEGQKALRKRLRKIREMPLDHEGVSPSEAGRILGMSRFKFMERAKEGYYDHIPRVRLRRGWLFELDSVMRTAYPEASKDKIAEFIRDYRESLFDRRGRKR